MKYGYIYITTNKVNGKIYIGQHKSKCHDEKYYGSGKLLTEALKKYSKENFTNEVICFCEDKNELDKMEKFFISYYKSQNLDIGYNLEFGGQGGDITEYLREKGKYESWRLSLVGKNNPMYHSGLEGRHPKGMLGKTHSEKYKLFLKEKMSDEHVNPMTNGTVVWGETHDHPKGMSGHEQTDYQKKRASETQKGVKKPDGFADKVSKRLKGVPKKPESILKRKATMANKPAMDVVCVNCDSIFKTRSKTAMYCSSKCARRYRANLNRKKDK